MKFVTLLRGINVGGHKKILMNDLKQLLQELGASNISTYIQSGNLIYEGGEIPAEEWSSRIEHLIHRRYGFDVPTITLTDANFIRAFNELPYESDIEQLHATFLSETPVPDKIQKLEGLSQKKDQFIIIDRVIYLKCAGKYSDSKLTNAAIESKLKVQATTRNWKTITALKAMLR